MTTAYLPDDCIYCILKYLQPYRSSLFNCLLVNRFWCEATVPLLYADPFRFKTILTNRHSTIILTLILCLNKTDILQLKNQLELIKINNININDEYKPLFYYPKYLENYNYYRINSTISHWIRLQNNLRDYYDLSKFEAIFHQSILRQCNNNIKKLEIPMSFNNNSEIQTFPKLNSLILHNSNKTASKFLSNLANVCSNLRKLEINTSYYLSPSKEKIYTVIQKQKNLKALRLSYCKPLLNDIFLSLVQKNSLVYVEFKDINFSNISFKNFINLCNLKYLKFNYCGGMSLKQCEVLKFASFKLEVLMTWKNHWNDDMIRSLMIKYLGASLKKLVSTEPLTVPIIEDISIYCLNLIALEIGFISNCSSVIPYFKNLEIRTLTLFNYNMSLKNSMNLASNLLTSVKEVSIWYPKYFEVFLANCHNYLEIIYLNGLSSYNRLDLLKIILNTKRSNNILKFYIMAKPSYHDENDENGEELELLDKIRAKGIKVTVVPYKYPDFKNYIYE